MINDFGSFIRAKRFEQDVSLSDCAAALGVPSSTWSSYEMNRLRIPDNAEFTNTLVGFFKLDNAQVAVLESAIESSNLTPFRLNLKLCNACNKENYTLAVLSGVCAWCGFDVNKNKEGGGL